MISQPSINPYHPREGGGLAAAKPPKKISMCNMHAKPPKKISMCNMHAKRIYKCGVAADRAPAFAGVG